MNNFTSVGKYANLKGSQISMQRINIYIVFFTPINFIFSLCFLPCLSICGIFGNIIAIKIFLLQSTIKSTCRIYYLALSFADLIFIISFAPSRWIEYGLSEISKDFFLLSIELYYDFTCKLGRFLWHSSWFCSHWILMCFSVERIIAIYFPLKRHILTISRAKKICLIIELFGFIGFSPILFLDAYYLRKSEGPIEERSCSLKIVPAFEMRAIWFLFMGFFLTVLVPPTILSITNILLWAKLKKIKNTRLGLLNRLVQKWRLKVQMKNAKDLILLSVLMIIFSFPVLTWLLIYAAKCMTFSQTINIYQIAELNRSINWKLVRIRNILFVRRVAKNFNIFWYGLFRIQRFRILRLKNFLVRIQRFRILRFPNSTIPNSTIRKGKAYLTKEN